MANKAKAFTHEQADITKRVLAAVAAQNNKTPSAKAQIGAEAGVEPKELTKYYQLLQSRGLVERRTGPEAKAVYMKITAAGKKFVAAWGTLYS